MSIAAIACDLPAVAPPCDRPPLTTASPPAAERPLTRIQRLGAEVLTTPELLDVLMSVRKGESAVNIGHRLLAAAGGSLRELAGEADSALRKIPGMGPGRIAQLDVVFELARRWATESPVSRPRVRGPHDIAALYAPRLQDLQVEEFHIAVLDTQYGVKRQTLITRGLLSTVPVHAREVFRSAVEASAAAIVLVHNHPSGDPTPSPEDRVITLQLCKSGTLLDIPVYDHVIIGRGRYVSFLEEHWL